jgi:flagellar assembly protein FliH
MSATDNAAGAKPSRVISPGEGETAFQRWELPNLLTADQLERIQQQAYDEGFARGRSDGLKSAQAEVEARLQSIGRILDTLAEPLAELDEDIEHELLAVALAAARVIVRREVKCDPALVIAAVREALAVLPAATRNVRVHLNPEDAAIMREVLKVGDEDRAWRLVEDPMQGRGGCKIVTDTSQIDASIDARLTGIMTAVLGGERAHD